MANPATVAFGLLIVGITVMLLVSYIKFVRMNAEIRRARLFIMAKRINRFLLAFTLGFLSITVLVIGSLVGITLPSSVTGAVAFFWLGAVLFGSVDLFLIASPRIHVWKDAPSRPEETQ